MSLFILIPLPSHYGPTYRNSPKYSIIIKNYRNQSIAENNEKNLRNNKCKNVNIIVRNFQNCQKQPMTVVRPAQWD